mmetsp:Transcript_45352/g.142206  ORF Transcript_45352/g.142206 Transcript_45352/m.142206 type:complete len:440 (+) Transcript_45352:864-2183(+)
MAALWLRRDAVEHIHSFGVNLGDEHHRSRRLALPRQGVGQRVINTSDDARLPHDLKHLLSHELPGDTCLLVLCGNARTRGLPAIFCRLQRRLVVIFRFLLRLGRLARVVLLSPVVAEVEEQLARLHVLEAAEAVLFVPARVLRLDLIEELQRAVAHDALLERAALLAEADGPLPRRLLLFALLPFPDALLMVYKPLVPALLGRALPEILKLLKGRALAEVLLFLQRNPVLLVELRDIQLLVLVVLRRCATQACPEAGAAREPGCLRPWGEARPRRPLRRGRGPGRRPRPRRRHPRPRGVRRRRARARARAVIGGVVVGRVRAAAAAVTGAVRVVEALEVLPIPPCLDGARERHGQHGGFARCNPAACQAFLTRSCNYWSGRGAILRREPGKAPLPKASTGPTPLLGAAGSAPLPRLDGRGSMIAVDAAPSGHERTRARE